MDIQNLNQVAYKILFKHLSDSIEEIKTLKENLVDAVDIFAKDNKFSKHLIDSSDELGTFMKSVINNNLINDVLIKVYNQVYNQLTMKVTNYNYILYLRIIDLVILDMENIKSKVLNLE